MAKRTRITTTVSQDDHVRPRRRSRKKNQNAIIIVFVIILVSIFLLSRTQRPGSFPTQPASMTRH